MEIILEKPGSLVHHQLFLDHFQVPMLTNSFQNAPQFFSLRELFGVSSIKLTTESLVDVTGGLRAGKWQKADLDLDHLH